jgi:hypothetical protein
MKAQEQVEKLRTIQESMHEIADKVVSLGDGSVMLNDVAEGKKQIAGAINTKGGSASADSSFSQLAEDIQTLPYAGISAEGIVQTEEFSLLEYVTSNINNKIVSINDSTIIEITRSDAFSKNIALREVVMNRLSKIQASGCFRGCISLQSINLENVTIMEASDCFRDCISLQSINLKNVTKVLGGVIFGGCTYLQSVNLENVTTFDVSYCFNACDNLRNLQLGTLKYCNEPFYTAKPNLRNITIGASTNINLPFQNWTATNVIAEGQSGIDELNSNLYNNLLTKLYDHSNDGETRTLRIGWLAHVTQENIDYANSKGWTLTT